MQKSQVIKVSETFNERAKKYYGENLLNDVQDFNFLAYVIVEYVSTFSSTQKKYFKHDKIRSFFLDSRIRF